jgi:hypothetical protein
MATDGDVSVNKCDSCGGNLAKAVLRRPLVNMQLNGQGGVWPAQTLVQGDVLEVAFRKNGGAWGVLPRQYEVKNNPAPGNTLVAYVTLKLEDTNFGGQ